ncbi:MAG TPA: ABC transporter permease [Bryobacteraceae bacterium]|nr:ABC transporter permease [Bryobacteraceae bacterium]
MRPWHWLFRRSQEERELDEELRFHLSEEAQLRIDRGESRESAWRSARQDFGNITSAQEVTRDMWGWTALERAAQDVRFAVRMLRKNVAFTAVALAALTLGIGATTAMFSVVYSVLLKPMTFPEPERVVMLWERQPSGRNNVVQTHNFLDWRQRNRSFLNIAAYLGVPANLSGDGDPVQVPGVRVTSGFFEILGAAPLFGRTIQAADDAVGAPPVAVLSAGLWQRRFGGRTDVLGQKIRVNGVPCEIIGVMPAGFEVPSLAADLYTPMQFDLANPGRGRNYRTVARLKPGVSTSAADADMQAIAAQLAQERPEDDYRWGVNIVPLLEQTVGDSRSTLLVLLGAVAFVLLIACANVANLLLMRGSARRREMTVRMALGAGRWRLLHQLIIESLLLSVSGGLMGFALAWWGVPVIVNSLPAGFPLPRSGEIAVDYRILGFTLFLSIACGVFFGIFPVWQMNRARMNDSLRQGGRGQTASSRGIRNALVVTEIGLAVLLVIGAGLMLRSFLLLHQTDPGFRLEHLLTFRMLLVPSKYPDAPRRAAVVEQMLDRIRALPLVSSASSIHVLPMTGGNSGTGYYRLDRPTPAIGAGTGGEISVISDRYFQTMGIPLLAGRDFDARDRLNAPAVAILNKSAARQMYPDENPVGKRMNVFWSGTPDVEIVGVVADIRHDGLNVEPSPTMFLPNAQRPNSFNSLVVRTKGDPAPVVAAVKEQMHQIDPDQGAFEIRTMEQLTAQSIARPKVQATLMGVFGLVALVLACVGIYAVVSYSVEQRTREMGIRLALGAAPLSILQMVLREGLFLAGGGILAGLLAAAGLTRYLSTLLYAVRPTDTLVYASVSATLAAAALAGCYFPARRATRVDPAVVLREE